MISDPSNGDLQMKIIGLYWSLGSLAVVLSTIKANAESIPVQVPELGREVSFEQDILPIFQRSCLACHGSGDEAGELVLESPQAMIDGGDSGPGLVAGKAEESLIFRVAAHLEDPIMPPSGNDVAAKNLTPRELGLLKLWIDRGARGSGGIDNLSPKQWAPLPPGVHPAQSITITQDGQYLACSRANQIFLYHVATGKLITKLSDPSLDVDGVSGIAHQDLVQSLAFNVDGDMLASGGFREAKVWRRPSDVQTFQIKSEPLSGAIAVSPDQRSFAIAHRDGSISVCLSQDGSTQQRLLGHQGAVHSICFTPDSKQLVSGSEDRTIRVWDIEQGIQTGIIETPAGIRSVAMLEDSASDNSQENIKDSGQWRIVTGDDQNAIRVWKIPNATDRKIPNMDEKIIYVASSRDDRLLVTASDSQTITVVDLGSEKESKEGKPTLKIKVSRPVSSLAISKVESGDQSLRKLAIGFTDGAVELRDLAATDTVSSWSVSDQAITTLEFSPDSNSLASGDASGAISLWDCKQVLPPQAIVNQEGSGENGLRVSHDRKRFISSAIVDGKSQVFLKETGDRKPVTELLCPQTLTTDVAFSLDDQVAVAGAGSQVFLWKLDGSATVQPLTLEVDRRIVCVGANQNGSQVFVGMDDHHLKLFNVTDNSLIAECSGHGGSLLGCGLIGSELYSISDDSTLRLWNSQNGQQIRSIDLKSKPSVYAFSNDSRLITCLGQDQQVRVIQLDNGNVLHTLAVTDAALVSMRFDESATRLIMVAENGNHSLWELATGRRTEGFDAIGSRDAWFDTPNQTINCLSSNGELITQKLRHQKSLEGNSDSIVGLEFHLNGQTLFSAAKDGSLRGYNTQSGQQTFATNHGAKVNDLAISENDQVLATAGENATVRLWQTNGSGFGAQQINQLPGPAKHVTFIRGTEQIAIASGDAEISVQVRGLSDAGTVQLYTGWSSQVLGLMSIRGSGDGNSAAPVIVSMTEEHIGWSEMLLERIYTGHSQPVTSLCVDPSRNQHLYSGSLDGTVRHWNLSNGQQIRQFNHGAAVHDIDVRSQGDRLASVGENARIRLYRTDNGQQLSEMRGDIRLQTQAIRKQQQLSSANARVNVAKRLFDNAETDLPKKDEAAKALADTLAKANETVKEKRKAFDAKMAEKLVAEKAAIDASLVAKDALEKQQNAERLAAQAALEMENAQGQVNQLQAVLSARPESLEIRQLLEGAQQSFNELQQRSKDLTAQVQQPTEKARQMAASANAATQQVANIQKPFSDAADELEKAEADQNLLSQQHALAVAEWKEAEQLVPQRKQALERAEKAKITAEEALAAANTALQESEKPVRSVKFSPDGKLIATAGDYANLHTWDAETGNAIAAFSGHTGQPLQSAFLDNNSLLSVSVDQTSRRWELNPAWELMQTLGDVADPSLIVHRATSVDFSPDSAYLLVASGVPSRTGELHVFDLASGNRSHHLPKAHDDVVYSARFSPDGKRIASGGADRYMRTFELGNLENTRRFEGHTDYVLGVHWKSDGESLVSASADATIKLWSFETGDQERTINQQLSKHITSVQYVGDTNTVISSSGDKRVRIHNGDNGGVIRTFSETESWQHQVIITPDSKVAAAADASGNVTVWNGTNGQLLVTLQPE